MQHKRDALIACDTDVATRSVSSAATTTFGEFVVSNGDVSEDELRAQMLQALPPEQRAELRKFFGQLDQLAAFCDRLLAAKAAGSRQAALMVDRIKREPRRRFLRERRAIGRRVAILTPIRARTRRPRARRRVRLGDRRGPPRESDDDDPQHVAHARRP
jgi:hypothetical protein